MKQDADDSPRGPVWTALVLTLPEAVGEELAGALAAFGPGAEYRGLGVGRGELWIYLASPELRPAVTARAAGLLEAHSLSLDRCAPRLEAVPEEPWVERYQAGLRAFRLGRRFVVEPAGDPRVEAGTVAIRLVPGRAFGTGEHPTTQLCVEQLERRVVPGSRWVDLGCGSAILSLVAVHCGARRVLALDVDEDAVEVAAEVVRANGLGARIEVRRGDAALAWTDADGVVANIEAAYFLRSAPEVMRIVKAGGLLVLSGIVDEQVDPVARCLVTAGARELERVGRGPWWVLTFRSGRG